MGSNTTNADSKLWTRGFIFLIITNLFVYQGFQMLIPVLPVYIMNIGGSAVQASLATSLFAVSGLIFRSLTGIGVDKFGRKPLLILGFIILFLLNISLFWASAVALILVLRFIHGVGWGMTSTTIATVMSDTVPAKRRGEGTGYYALSVILATSAAPMIAIALMNKFDFKVVLAISSAAILIGFILAQGMSIKKVKVEKKVNQNFWKDLFEKKALFPSFLCLLLAIPFGSLMSYILTFGKEIGIENVWIYYIGHCLMIIVSRPFIGKLFDRKGHVWAILPGIISMFIGLMLLSFTNGTGMLIVASIFFGFGFGAAQPSLQAWAINRSPDHRKGAANGTFLSAMDLGAALGIFLLGIAGAAFGYHMMFRIGSYFIVALILFYAVYLVRNRHPHTKKVSEQTVLGNGSLKSAEVPASICSNILIAFNDTELSNKALQTARKIAVEHNEIQIDILYALETPLGPNFEPSQEYQANKEENDEYAKIVAAKARKTFEDLPNTIHIYSVDSDPVTSILTHIKNHHNDLVIMGSRGLKGVNEYLKSVSHEVVQKSPVPVLIVK